MSRGSQFSLQAVFLFPTLRNRQTTSKILPVVSTSSDKINENGTLGIELIAHSAKDDCSSALSKLSGSHTDSFIARRGYQRPFDGPWKFYLQSASKLAWQPYPRAIHTIYAQPADCPTWHAIMVGRSRRTSRLRVATHRTIPR